MLKKMKHHISRFWNQYKYRFVPWIVLNFQNKSVRSLENNNSKNYIKDFTVEASLSRLFSSFKYMEGNTCDDQLYQDNLEILYKTCGFVIERCNSDIPGAGKGVKVTKGHILKDSVVAIYPGTVYQVYEPILLQSLGNPFVFRCIDGLLVDGNDKGISKHLYKSCAGRDRIGPYETCDVAWLTSHPCNPLAVGQYVNNQNKDFPANVAYQEYDFPIEFDFNLRKFIPNVFYSTTDTSTQPERLMRTVVLVSTQDIKSGEELRSSYFTVVI